MEGSQTQRTEEGERAAERKDWSKEVVDSGHDGCAVSCLDWLHPGPSKREPWSVLVLVLVLA